MQVARNHCLSSSLRYEVPRIASQLLRFVTRGTVGTGALVGGGNSVAVRNGGSVAVDGASVIVAGTEVASRTSVARATSWMALIVGSSSFGVFSFAQARLKATPSRATESVTKRRMCLPRATFPSQHQKPALPRSRPRSLFFVRRPIRFGSPDVTAFVSAERRASLKTNLTRPIVKPPSSSPRFRRSIALPACVSRVKKSREFLSI